MAITGEVKTQRQNKKTTSLLADSSRPKKLKTEREDTVTRARNRNKSRLEGAQ